MCITAAPQLVVLVTATTSRDDSLEKTPDTFSDSIFWMGLNFTKWNHRKSKQNDVMHAASLCRCPGRGWSCKRCQILWRDLESMWSRGGIQVIAWQPSFISSWKGAEENVFFLSNVWESYDEIEFYWWSVVIEFHQFAYRKYKFMLFRQYP